MSDLIKLAQDVSDLLDQYFEDRKEAEDETEYPTFAQRNEAGRQINAEYTTKIAEAFNEHR